MTAPNPRRLPLRLSITNTSSKVVELVLEPLGEVYAMEPGQERVVSYESNAPSDMGIDVGDREIKLWEEGDGILELAT